MTDDLVTRFVEQLRQAGGEAGVQCDECLPLAEAIEALEEQCDIAHEEVEYLEAVLDDLQKGFDNAHVRIEALTAERDYTEGTNDTLIALNQSLTADNARLKDMADKCTRIANDAISMCNEGHPVRAKNLALAIIRVLQSKGRG